jgi:amidohydrolase
MVMTHTYAKKFESYVIDVRRDLHKIPELSWQEEKTLDYIRRELQEIATQSRFPLHIEERKGGIWVDLDIDPSYKRLLFRADIDALPIQEETGLPFASRHPGCMHACGHDTHTAMLLGACKAIVTGDLPLVHNIRFVWQRAEENAWTTSGGEVLASEGVCDGVDAAYALHIGATFEAGRFYSKPGVGLANAAHLNIEIRCPGGHTMHPHGGANAIDVATDIHLALRGLPLRIVGPLHPVSFVPTMSQSGSAPNIMPNKAVLFYSLRNILSESDRDRLVEAIREKVASVTKTYGGTAVSDFTFYPGFPPLINDPDAYAATRDTLEGHRLKTGLAEITFAGEDFAYYLKKRPGAFWTLGARQGEAWDHHTSLFNPDERQFVKGVEFWLALATTACVAGDWDRSGAEQSELLRINT